MFCLEFIRIIYYFIINICIYILNYLLILIYKNKKNY